MDLLEKSFQPVFSMVNANIPPGQRLHPSDGEKCQADRNSISVFRKPRKDKNKGSEKETHSHLPCIPVNIIRVAKNG